MSNKHLDSVEDRLARVAALAETTVNQMERLVKMAKAERSARVTEVEALDKALQGLSRFDEAMERIDGIETMVARLDAALTRTVAAQGEKVAEVNAAMDGSIERLQSFRAAASVAFTVAESLRGSEVRAGEHAERMAVVDTWTVRLAEAVELLVALLNEKSAPLKEANAAEAFLGVEA